MTPLPDPDDPAALLARMRALIARGEAESALAIARDAIAGAPSSALVRAIGHHVFAEGIDGFHVDMLRDEARTAAYAGAIARLAPGRRVLDIGTGSGLLALLAARAGAHHVYACEADSRLALTAREIVAANGLADRVTVLPLHSDELDRDAHLGGGVDLVLSELFSQDLLGEGVLRTLADVRARLCLPGARFLPARAAIRVALADFAGSPPTLGEVAGCDLGPFNRHAPAQEPLRQGRRDCALRSAPADLFALACDGASPREARARRPLASTGGRVTGLVQWIRFETAPGLVYENAPAPGAESSHWVLVHHRLPRPIATAPGDLVPVHGWYSDETLLVWCGD
ncbi:MAG: 50S ribosomal protein L11 methyltransferase [Sphingomonadales bacterium]|nr:50S ribosomal protein L11 methyltransferase [Sphingomonadales bacterium]